MKKSTKAVLLSAFVFPGAGHLYLKKYVPGCILAGVSLVGIYYLVTKTVERAWEIAEKIQSGAVQLDATTIAELVSQQSAGTDAQLTNIATLAIIICWVFGIIDSYRVGRVRGKNEQDLINGKTQQGK
jgi:TM2 domain-containing membrane protein YozV